MVQEAEQLFQIHTDGVRHCESPASQPPLPVSFIHNGGRNFLISRRSLTTALKVATDIYLDDAPEPARVAVKSQSVHADQRSTRRCSSVRSISSRQRRRILSAIGLTISTSETFKVFIWSCIMEGSTFISLLWRRRRLASLQLSWKSKEIIPSWVRTLGVRAERM